MSSDLGCGARHQGDGGPAALLLGTPPSRRTGALAIALAPGLLAAAGFTMPAAIPRGRAQGSNQIGGLAGPEHKQQRELGHHASHRPTRVPRWAARQGSAGAG